MAPLIGGKAVGFVNVSDGARAAAFYGETLGLRMLSRDEHGMSFAVGDALLRVTPLPDHKAGPHPLFGWDVTDISVTAKALADAGVSLTIYEGFGQDALGIWTAPDGSAKVAWFADPDGNVLSLTEARQA